MQLDGKVAVITGAGGGIGRATALRCSAEGASVVVADIRQDEGETTVEQIRASGGDALYVSVDVRSGDQVADLMACARKWRKRIDILFNNAGIGPPSDTRATDLTEDAWTEIMAVNLTGVFHCCKYGIPYLIEGGGGSVINTASIAGLRANRAIPSTAYTVSKAGVIALTRQCAADYAAHQVRVNAICPGPIDTPILDPFMSDPAIRQRFTVEVPLGRMGQPTDIANLVLFLVSEQAAWIHGAAIVIDGGITV